MYINWRHLVICNNPNLTMNGAYQSDHCIVICYFII